MAEFQQLETWAEGMLQKMGTSGRKRLTMRIARELRRVNAKRITSQKGPDGEKWEGRKKQAKAAKPLRYVYQKRDGSVRELEMSSYRRENGRIIGYDKEARGIRTMLGQRVLRKIATQHGNAVSKANDRRAQRMMKGLAQPAHLHQRGTPSSAIVEFSERAQRIAAVHHWGERDKVSPGGPDYDYPARQLLGISKEDSELIMDVIFGHLSA